MKIEVINEDVLTKDGWQTFLMNMCAELAELAAVEEQKLATVTLICLSDPQTERPYDQPKQVRIATVFHGPFEDGQVADQKREFVQAVRCHALLGNAIASALTTEAWVAFNVNPKDKRRPEQQPNRKDALVITADHRDFKGSQHMAIIHSNPDGKTRRVDPWTHDYIGEEFGLGGAFSSFVPPAVKDPHKRLFALQLAKKYLKEMAPYIKTVFRRDDHASE